MKKQQEESQQLSIDLFEVKQEWEYFMQMEEEKKRIEKEQNRVIIIDIY